MGHKLSFNLFSPEHGAYDTLFPPDCAILFGAPVSSQVFNRQGKPGDLSIRAKALAEALGARVIAYQDPGPTESIPGLLVARHRLSSEQRFGQYATECARTLGSYLEAQHIGSVVMRIHSGNGPLGTATAQSLLYANTGPKVTHVVASDPAGIRKSSFWDFARRWRAYDNNVAPLTPNEHLAPNPLASNGRRAFYGDALVVRGSTVWRGDSTRKGLIAIGNDYPDVAVHLRLPEHSFNGTPDEMQEMCHSIQGAVSRRPEDAPFEAVYAPGEFHGSVYDNGQRHAEFIRQAVGSSSQQRDA